MKSIKNSIIVGILLVTAVAALPQFGNVDNDENDNDNGQPQFNYAQGNSDGSPSQSSVGDSNQGQTSSFATGNNDNAPYNPINVADTALTNSDSPNVQASADSSNSGSQSVDDTPQQSVDAAPGTISTSSDDSAAALTSTSSDDSAATLTSPGSDNSASASASTTSDDTSASASTSGDTAALASTSSDDNSATASAASNVDTVAKVSVLDTPTDQASIAAAASADAVISTNAIDVVPAASGVDVDPSIALKRSTDLNELTVDQGESLTSIKRQAKKDKPMKLDFGMSASSGRSNKLRRRFPSAFCELERDNGIICPGIRRGNFIDQFYFDPSTNRCYHYVYNGCGGNANRFSSLWECTQSCVKKGTKV